MPRQSMSWEATELATSGVLTPKKDRGNTAFTKMPAHSVPTKSRFRWRRSGVSAGLAPIESRRLKKPAVAERGMVQGERVKIHKTCEYNHLWRLVGPSCVSVSAFALRAY